MKNKISFLCLCLCALFVFAACSTTPEKFHANPDFNPGPEDKLTDAELKLMINNARQTVLASSKSKEKGRIPETAAKEVNAKEPAVEIYYHGKKYGVMRLQWKLSRNAEIVMSLKGELLTEKPRWQMGVRATQSDSALEKSRRKK